MSSGVREESVAGTGARVVGETLVGAAMAALVGYLLFGEAALVIVGIVAVFSLLTGTRSTVRAERREVSAMVSWAETRAMQRESGLDGSRSWSAVQR